MKHHITTLMHPMTTIAVGALAVLASPLQANPCDPFEVLVQETFFDNTGVGPSFIWALASDCIQGYSAADDFILTESFDIVEVTWVGVYYQNAIDLPGDDFNFRITFYEDNGAGNVGAVIADFPSVSVTKTFHPRPLLGGTYRVYSYHTILPSSVPTIAGQRYWISINGNPTNDVSGPTWGWMASRNGNAPFVPGNEQPLQIDQMTCETLPATTYSQGGLDGGTDADFAFTLFGCLAIPKPCTADISSPTGDGPDGRVDVFDLFALLAQWGECD